MGGASVHLVTDERIEASKTEVCPWSKGEQGPVLGADGPAEGSPPHICSQSWIVTAAHQSQEKREVRGREDAEVSVIFRFYPKGDGRN